MNYYKTILLVFGLLAILSSGPSTLMAQSVQTSGSDFSGPTYEKLLDELATDQIPQLNKNVNFSVSGTNLEELLRSVADIHKINMSIGPKLKEPVNNSFSGVTVKDLLLFLSKEYQIKIENTGSILSLTRWEAPLAEQLDISMDESGRLISIDVSSADLASVAQVITEKSPFNVLVESTVDKKINAYLENLPIPVALERLAAMNNLALDLSENNIAFFRNSDTKKPQPSGQNDTFFDLQIDQEENQVFLTLDAVNAPIAQIIDQINQDWDIDFLVLSYPEGVTTAKFDMLPVMTAIDHLLKGTTHTYKKDDGVILIGDRQQEGLRNTSVYRFEHRSVEGILASIPLELLEGVRATEFVELNALILSGSHPQINEVTAFLKAIDVRIPNILIEVIVTDFKDGYSLQTGFTAGLTSDSTIKTQGSVFGGTDVTLSSGSVNNLLGKLASKNLINLGQVTPNFYARLEALEVNEKIDIRSTPKLATLNGHEANLIIGESVYFLIETQNVSPGINPIVTVTPNYEKVEANLMIRIKPFVSEDEQITLDLTAEFSDFIAPEIEGAPPGNATRKFDSQIRMGDGEMIVLGGLEEESSSEGGSGTPFLSRIPVLKWLFSRKQKSKSESKLVIFIRPQIIY